LLFYTEGSYVWDQNGNLMPNGSDLTGLPNLSGNESPTISTAQGAIIVPMPDSVHKYYIFSLTSIENRINGNAGKLYYSIVNMDLNGGLGDVVAGEKGILIDSGLSERMTAIVGNQCNIWLLVCSPDSLFKAYEITALGIAANPVISSVGNYLATSIVGVGEGCLAVAPNGKKIATTEIFTSSLSRSTATLYDFDASSGKVSNPISLIPAGMETSYGAAFSLDNSKLYVEVMSGSIYQFDLSSGNSAIIPGTKTYIGAGMGGDIGDLKLGPNGKIYFGVYTTYPSVLGCINTPNLAGIACQYSTIDSIDVSNGFFPNVVPIIKRDTVFSIDTITGCTSENTLLSAADTTGLDYMWNEGTSGRHYIADTAGTYWVQYHTSPCVFHIDTFIVHKIDLNPVINVNGFDLSTTQTYDTYQWLLNGKIIPGAINHNYTVKQNGEYTVIVSDRKTGCTDTSAVYTVTNYTGIENIAALVRQIKIYPNPASDLIYINAPVRVNACITDIEGKLIKKEQYARAINVKDLAGGIYLIRVTNQSGILLKVTKFLKVK